MRHTASSRVCLAGLCVLMCLVPACQEGWQEKIKAAFGKKELPPEQPPPSIDPNNAALSDTIGSEALLAGMGGLAVRGFGVVIGLGDKGSSECPPSIKEYVTDYLDRTYKLKANRLNEPDFSAAKMLSTPDSAVVEVLGIIPPGAPSGSRFDIAIEAVAGTQTRSLEGGLLIPCELKIVDVAYKGDKLIAGRTVAMAAGPVYVDPPGSSVDATPSNPRRGAVLGGGRSKENRNVRLTLNTPSYATARRIEQRINARFGGTPKTAEAMSRGYVEVRTPAGYEDDPPRFMRLITHLFLREEAGFIEKKLDDLAAAVERGDRQLEDIALAWEGIGKIAIPRIQPYYAHRDVSVAYYAARAGLRLGDASALPIVGQVAAAEKHPQRLDAVRELGWCKLQQAGNSLTPLLNDRNPDICIAAYEALLRQRHPAVQSRRIPFALDAHSDNLWLDVIETAGTPLIYVRRTGVPRIAVFGAKIPCRLPLFYSLPDGAATLNAVDAGGDITLFCRTKRSKRLSDPLTVAPRVVDLIRSMADMPLNDEGGRLRGIGLAYSQVVQTLDSLCRQETIPARLVMQPWSMTDLIEPEMTPERKESDDSDGPAEIAAETAAAGAPASDASEPAVPAARAGESKPAPRGSKAPPPAPKREPAEGRPDGG